MARDVSEIVDFGDTHWSDAAGTRGVESVVEGGAVLRFTQLAFELAPNELRLLDPVWTDGRAKNVSMRWPSAQMRGAAGAPSDLADLRGVLERYAQSSETFVLRLFPHYRGALRRGNTSLRLVDVAGRPTSWRKDDTRLHLDAFPSNPMHGTRVLRVFCNVNPSGRPRHWRIGEPFEAHARRYLSRLGRPLPGSAWLMQTLGVTKRRRSEYDHVMLQLHDLAKADGEFQRDSPQTHVDFAPGTTWVVYSDQVLHAAMGGQHMFEQTFYLDVAAQRDAHTSPLRQLERLLGRTLH